MTCRSSEAGRQVVWFDTGKVVQRATSNQGQHLIFQRYLSSILDREEIKLFLHAEVVEVQIDSTLGVGDDQPHTVHIVSVLLGVVGRQQHPGWSGKVEETGNCRSDKERRTERKRNKYKTMHFIEPVEIPLTSHILWTCNTSGRKFKDTTITTNLLNCA